MIFFQEEIKKHKYEVNSMIKKVKNKNIQETLFGREIFKEEMKLSKAPQTVRLFYSLSLVRLKGGKTCLC